jgi:ATP-dependent Lon protease
LREQVRQIQKELGEDHVEGEDLKELEEQLRKAKLSTLAKKEAEKQMMRLKRMGAESSEYALLRTYLEWLADLPWSKRSKQQVDLKKVRDILDEDHFGLEKVKERISP